MKCKSLGYAEEDIVLDIVLSNSRKNLEKDISNYTTISGYTRSVELINFLEEFYYIDQVITSHPLVNFRYIIFPTVKLPEYPGVPLNFNAKDLKAMFEIGYKDAANAIKSKNNYQKWRNQ